MKIFHGFFVFSLILSGSIAALSHKASAKDNLQTATPPFKIAQADRGYIPDEGAEGPRRITPDRPRDYTPPDDYSPRTYDRRPSDNYGDSQRRRSPGQEERHVTDSEYSSNEITRAGHEFFGSVSVGLAKVIEHAFKEQGRPNGYILGEEAGGAIVAGLRYGEGMLHTKNAGRHKVYWQGPSVGYDLGASGAKTMILVYNLYAPRDVYSRFGGVSGSAYFVGGVGMTFLKRDHVTMAPIVAGLGLRLGANIGYLKFTRGPTGNPF